jgi:hypothetical protein
MARAADRYTPLVMAVAQVMDRPSALASAGLPFVFRRFRLDGRIPPLDASLEATVDSGRPVPVDRAGRRVDQFPLGRDVLSFAGR